MKKFSLILLSVFAISLFSLESQALLEVRAGYGLLTTDSEDISGVEVQGLGGITADVLVSLPLVPIGFGLRYETIGMKNDANIGTVSTEIDITYDRISLVLNKRLIDMLIYAGPIATIGISESAEAKVSANGVSSGTGKYDEGMTFTVGAEAGAGLGLFSVGAELGYQIGELEGDAGAKFKTDGLYFKAMVGVGF